MSPRSEYSALFGTAYLVVTEMQILMFKGLKVLLKMRVLKVYQSRVLMYSVRIEFAD